MSTNEAWGPTGPAAAPGHQGAVGVEAKTAALAGTQPPLLYPPYRSTVRRAPSRPLIQVPRGLVDLAAPLFGFLPIGETDHDLTRQHPGEPIGERIIVSGRVTDEDGRPVANTLVEIWQANAAGRYNHAVDDHPAPLDANFTGAGRTMTDADGHYRFVTIKPGAYPWRNHANAWRPAHIHFSLFGSSFLTRLVTQMYFPNDPLFPYDPMFQSIRDERARQRLVSKFDLDLTQPEWALGYRFDIVLRGRESTPFEQRT
jgi:protocatechuate 3,4-dioxygenase beta subunit